MLVSPLHPLLVHFPIALLIFGVIAQFIAIWKKDFFDKAAFYLFGSGVIMGIFSYATGDGAIADAKLKWGSATLAMVETHETFAAISLIIFGIIFILKVLHAFKKIPRLLPLLLILGIAGTITLGLTGHYGGKMVYVQPTSVSFIETNTTLI